MRELEGVLWIGLAILLLWLGITGRFEKMALAIGVLREQPANPVIAPPAQATGSPVPLGMASSLFETTYNRELMGK